MVDLVGKVCLACAERVWIESTLGSKLVKSRFDLVKIDFAIFARCR